MGEWPVCSQTSLTTIHTLCHKHPDTLAVQCSGHRAGVFVVLLHSPLPLARHLSVALQCGGSGVGPTVFDWLVEIIRRHCPGGEEEQNGVELVLA